MPLGFERINERTQRPNPLVNFIKPLPGPASQTTTAELILSRVAAVCYPFMKQHQILVQALEEFPHNNEFVGRNFNAGEVIQLVLKNRRGEWLPERWVQMVMVHELAHCKEMNHGARFWKWRNEFAGDLKGLWGKGYTGEGMWGRGRNLLGGEIMTGEVDNGLMPENLCGGTYGRKRGKRKRDSKGKETLSYAERKQRRILKKFGAGGQALGADDDTKVKLEGGVAKKGKPRVAKSARGRELRAAAALARFDQVKKEEVAVKEEPSDSDTEDDYEEPDDTEAALDIDGSKMKDENGHGLVKICEGEDGADENAKREMAEFQEIRNPVPRAKPTTYSKSSEEIMLQKTQKSSSIFVNEPGSKLSTTSNKPESRLNGTSTSSNSTGTSSAQVIHLDEIYKRRFENSAPKASYECRVCSLINEAGPSICAACSNVLNPHFMLNHWRCPTASCKEVQYINAGDVGICGVCGTAKPTKAA